MKSAMQACAVPAMLVLGCVAIPALVRVLGVIFEACNKLSPTV